MARMFNHHTMSIPFSVRKRQMEVFFMTHFLVLTTTTCHHTNPSPGTLVHTTGIKTRAKATEVFNIMKHNRSQ